MSKSYKLNNGIYIDDSSIIHKDTNGNRKTLKEILNTYSILFEGDSTGDITLSDNATNYDYIEVEFRNTYSSKQATNVAKLYPENNKYFTLMNANFDGNAYIYASNYYFDGASIKHGIVGGTTSTHVGYRIQASSSMSVSGGDYISILKVIGYKK